MATRYLPLAALLALLTGCQLMPAADDAPRQPLSWPDVVALPAPASGAVHRYGPAPQQFGELRLPEGPGPYPVLVLIHGGCWLSDFDYRYFNHFGAAFAELGYATWTIEYRRLGDPGGGWPGTFEDIGVAIDHLNALAVDAPLDLDRVVLAGHSAGGQLALWAAGRAHQPDASAPRPAAVLGLAAITDLASYRIGPPGSCHAAVEPLLGGTPEQVPERYAQTSPLELGRLDMPIALVHGDADTIVPIASAKAYAAVTGAQLFNVAGAGHFDTGVPQGLAWPAIREALAAVASP